MSLFLLFFAGVVCFLVLLAVAAELLSKFSRDDYEIPDDWKSQIYEDVSGKPVTSSNKQVETTDAPPAHKELTASAWYTMVIIAYALCLLALTQWELFEPYLYTAKQLLEQLRARP